jgi:hypothetical protein
MKIDSTLITWLLVLVAEIALFIFCRFKLKQPVDPLKPRLIPYGLIMIFLALAMFVTLAHLIGLVTGVQVMPKRGKMMR